MLKILFTFAGKISWQYTRNFLNFMDVVLPLNLGDDAISLMKLCYFFIFNWRIISSDCCVGFSHRVTWFSYKYARSVWNPRFTTLIPPLWVSLRHCIELHVSHSSCPLAVPHVMCMCFRAALSVHPSLSFPRRVSSLSSMSASLFLSWK